MKNKFKNVCFKVLMVTLAVLSIGIFNVEALTIKETAQVGTGYDTIENGTTVIGITKFTPSVTVTAKRVSTATLNALAYSAASEVHIYYYYGVWFELDDANEAHVVANPESLKELNIFYVDNVEKQLTIPYSGSTQNLTFKTDKLNKDREVSYANGVITVPATVSSLTVYSNNAKQATFAKASESDMGFLENPMTGRIISLDSGLISLSGTQSITLQGNVPFKIMEDAVNGNYVSVGIQTEDGSRPEAEDREKIKFTVFDAATPEGADYAWDTNSSYHELDVMFTDDVREATIQVTWAQGNSQTFKVNLTESSTLESSPDGKIDWDYLYGGNYGYDDQSVKDVIFFDNLIDYMTFDEENLAPGNRVGIYIYPSQKYSTMSTVPTIEIIGNAANDDAVPTLAYDEYNGVRTPVIHYIPLITDEARVINIKVTWEPGFTQIFTIDASSATLQSSEVIANEEID